MQKKEYLMLSLVMFMTVFLVVGHMPVLLADENDTDNSGRNSNETDDDSDDENETEDDEDENDRVRERTETRTRERNGEVEREFRTEIRTADGEKIKIERKIKIKNGEIEIKTKLKIEGSGSNFSVIDSEGERHRVRVTPEKLRMLMLERLNASNITEFSLDEIEHKNIPRVVFKVNSDHPGRFLGIFKLAVKAETQVDPVTGEILDVNVPWWVFLVAGEEVPDSDEIVGNETLEDEIIASDEELEEEFEKVEVKETFNNTEVEVSGDVALDEETQATLDSLVASFAAVEDKIELKLKAKKQDNKTLVEAEIKEGTLNENQQNLWETLQSRAQTLVENAEGDDIELEIEIEHELELDDEEDEEEVEEEEETENTTNSSG